MQTLKMDFQSQSTPPVVPVMQSDAQSRFIGISLYNGGVPYEAPEGASYTVQYRGPGANNMGWYDTITLSSGTRKAVIVDSTSKNVVTLELAEQALRVNGNVFVNLCVVTNTGYMLKTFPILCRVTGAAFPDTVAVQSFFYVTGITSEQWLAYVTACQDAQKRAEDAVATFETDPTLSVSGKAADAKETGNNVFSALTIASRKPFTTSLPYNLIQLADLTFGVNLYTALEQNIFRTYSEPNTAITGVIPVSDKYIHIYDKRGAKFITLFEYDYTGKLLKHSDSLVDYTLLSDTSYIRLSIGSVNDVNDVITNGTSACYGNYSSNYANSTESLQITNCYIGSYKPTALNIQRGYITGNVFYENEMYMSARVPVAPGTKVKVTCFLRGASLFPIAEFLDYNGNVIGTTSKTTTDTIYCCKEVEIPAGCSAIVVNSYRDNTTPLQVLTNYQSVTEKIGYTGDSICYGLGYAGGYAGIIDKQLGITSNNVGVSGGHIAKDRTDVFVISDSISLLDNDISMLIMEGGINDYSNYVDIGAITDDYTADLDQTTFYGGLEKLMRDANNRFPEIPKAFVIVHKVNLSCVQDPNDVHANNVTFENYIDAIYACCRKYSIDVIDINKHSGFNTYLPDIARKYTFKDDQHPTGDGLHPNIAGYSKWYVPAIVNWIEQRQGATNSILLA